MEQKVILFDLDGTLTDSGEGIINCVVFALEHYGLPVPSKAELRSVVGPPLHDTLAFQRRSWTRPSPFSAAATIPSAFMKTSLTPASGKRWKS